MVYSLKFNTCKKHLRGTNIPVDKKNRITLHECGLTKSCALATHVLSSNHSIHWDSVKILEVELNTS